MNELQNLLNRINQLLNERHWSASEACRIAEISENTISRWMTGNVEPSYPSLVRLAKAFDLSAAQLIAYSPEDVAEADEREVLRCYRLLEQKQKDAFLTYLKELTN